ncbi:MAG: DUF3343 domain-containing protein [Clostridiaceae bacterium]|nr:DUF3343 domain-containing protein [Clostridiaceae bacterium]
MFRKKSNSNYLYIFFEETNHAFMAEKFFKGAGLKGKLVSAPSFLTAGCGLAWRGPVETEEEAKGLILENDISHEKIMIH